MCPAMLLYIMADGDLIEFTICIVILFSKIIVEIIRIVGLQIVIERYSLRA